MSPAKNRPSLARLALRFTGLFLGFGSPFAGTIAAADLPPSAAQKLEQYALTHAGDAARGRKLFQSESLTKCAVCHKVGSQGGDLGPDLTHIGGKFTRPHLIESLLEPSRQIVEGYRTSLLATQDGTVYTGIVKEQSADKLTLLDAAGKRLTLRTDELFERRESPLSLMPENLAQQLSAEQFTDLVAYLETLRAGGKPTPGSGITGPITLPALFQVRTLATGLSGATALETLADGRILVCEQTGTLLVVEGGKLLPAPMLELAVDSTWERGLLGVAVDPDFPRAPYIYVCYVAREPYPHHCLSRFTVEGNVARPGSEQVLLAGDDQRQLGGKVPAGHQGGALHFGADGKLYLALGEQTAETPAQRLDTLQGKILRLNRDGSIPADNPFVRETSGKYQAIWALGLRNPFTFAVRPLRGELFINDVGGKFEEINRGLPGANYGWPAVDHGPTTDARFRGPAYYYPQASIAGGDFCPAASPWPADFRGRYFFADFVHGWIKTLDPDKPQDVRQFALGLSRSVDLRFGPVGSLFVLLRNAWVIDGKFQPGTGALVEIRYAP